LWGGSQPTTQKQKQIERKKKLKLKCINKSINLLWVAGSTWLLPHSNEQGPIIQPRSFSFLLGLEERERY